MENTFLLEGHRSVNGLLRKLALGMDRQTLNNKIIRLTERLFGERKASILLLNSKGNSLHLEFAPSLPDFYNQAIEGVGIGENIGSCGAAAFLKQPIIVDDINTHPNWAPFVELTQKANLHACWSVPILSSKEHVLGTFAIYSNKPATPKTFELEILELLSSLYSVALEKFELENQLKYHANHDALTHCYNRRALLDKVESMLTRACFHNKVMSCVFIDIDNFKYINDNFGHKLGDDVLVRVADSLNASAISCTQVGRFGGDEFLVFSCFASKKIAMQHYLTLNEALQEALTFDDFEFNASVGMSCSELNCEVILDDLIASADRHMYKIKQSKIRR